MSIVEFALGNISKVRTGWTVAVVSEGYTQKELDEGLFDVDVMDFVHELLITRPFNGRAIRPVLSVVKVRKASKKTGNDIPPPPPPGEVVPYPPPPERYDLSNTAFGAMFGVTTTHGAQKFPLRHPIIGNSGAARDYVRVQEGLAEVNHILVIVNNTKTVAGEMWERVGWFSKAKVDWPNTAIHELGHQAFELLDEYAYDRLEDPVTVYTDPEPNGPNVTTETVIAKMKWRDLVTLPQKYVPTTKKPEPEYNLTHEKEIIRTDPPDPPITEDAIGAYEGANHHDYGIYRPSLNCKMRDSNEYFFCRVCESKIRADLGHYALIPHEGLRLRIGRWTHIQSFPWRTYPRMLAYDALSGWYAISSRNDFGHKPPRPDGTPRIDLWNFLPGTGTIEPGWTWLVPFDLDGALHYFAHQFGFGRQGMFRMDDIGLTLTKTWGTPPAPNWTPTTWTHIVTLTIAGKPHYIGYNTFKGEASLYHIDSDASDPKFLYSMQWGPEHTALLSIPLDGDPFVLTYRIGTGEVVIRRITPSGFQESYASPSGFWVRNVTHLAHFDLGGLTYIVRYSALDGSGSIWHIRAGGAGLDFVCSLVPAPGIGGLSILGTGAPALGKFMATEPTSNRGESAKEAGGNAQSSELFFYSALHQTLRTYALSPVG